MTHKSPVVNDLTLFLIEKLNWELLSEKFIKINSLALILGPKLSEKRLCQYTFGAPWRQ